MNKRLYIYTATAFFLLNLALHAQTEKTRWYKNEADFTVKLQNTGNSGGGLTGMLRAGYGYLISDHDGDNCPFEPTCSAFAAGAVAKHGIFKGILMFADRFTRDTNLFKDWSKYGMAPSGRLYDPVENNDNDNVYYFNPTISR